MFPSLVHFVHHDVDMWADVCSADTPPPPAEYGARLRHGNDNWVLQTYLELKRRSLNVEILPHLVPGEICVAHYDDIMLKEVPTRCFLVGIRGDRPDIHVSAINVVQNPRAACRKTDCFMPHWTQPGLMPRDPSRGNTIAKIGYLGMRFNLHPAFLAPEFLQRLGELGVTLEIREYPFQDYTDLDLILAVRPGTEYDINLKPASKLQNAWLAGCPALLGPESGYQHYRRSELDYIEVTSPGDALKAIRHLKSNPMVYTAMVDNGNKRAREYTHDSIAQLWIDFFAGTVMPAYQRWRQSRPRFDWLDYPRFTLSATRHKLARRYHMRKI